jgi:hypothetical protein
MFSEVCETLGSLKKDSTAQFLRAVTNMRKQALSPTFFKKTNKKMTKKVGYTRSKIKKPKRVK